MKLLKNICLLVLSTSLLFSGCIGDDRSGCPPDNNLALVFSYLNFPQHINHVTVGIYDTNGLLVSSVQAEKSRLDIFQGMQLSLPTGSYTAVCWGNAFDNTQIKGLTTGESISRHEVAHPGYFTPAPIPTNDSLYYGITNFTIREYTTLNETVTFTPAYIRLVIQVNGLASTAVGMPAADYPYVKVDNLVPAYDFMMVTHGDPVTYYPAVLVDVAQRRAEAVCDVLRFSENNPITIEVVENSTTNAILHTLNLQSFIAANNISIEDGREMLIPIKITFDAGMNVTVGIIESWGGIPVDPQPQQ